LTSFRVIIDRFWTDNWIYWTLTSLHFTDHCNTKTSALNHVAWQWLPTVDVPLLPGSHPHRLAAISHQPPTFLTAFSRLSHNGSWYSLYSLRTDRTKNTVPLLCAIVVKLMSCLQCCNLVTALSSVMSHCSLLKAAHPK
jgi:hypothetical protein